MPSTQAVFKNASPPIRLSISSSNGQSREQYKGVISDGAVVVTLG